MSMSSAVRLLCALLALIGASAGAHAQNSCPAAGPCTLQPTRSPTCAAGSSGNSGLLHLQLRIGTSAHACPVVDTGSNGIVLSAKYLRGANVVRAARQPPTPRYTSDGKTYTGFWVTASNVTVADPLNNARTIPQIDLFCATDTAELAASGQCACASQTTCPSVAMMGVGFGTVPYYSPDYNAFLQIAAGAAAGGSGTCTGYAIEGGARQIRIGLSETEPRYVMAKLPPKTAGTTPTGNCGPPSGWSWDWDRPIATASATMGASSFQQQTKLLIDSGIEYMILSNNDERWPAFQPQGDTQFVPGVKVQVTLPGVSGTALDYSFTTVAASPAPPPPPAYVRWGSPGAGNPGIINTGNQILIGTDYLYDYSRGLNGFSANGN